jgi:integrase
VKCLPCGTHGQRSGGISSGHSRNSAPSLSPGENPLRSHRITRYNNALDTLRLIFDKAIEQGLIFKNPVTGIAKKAPSKKRLELPSRDEFTNVVASMRKAGGWCSDQCSDLVEFLAYSGCRIDKSRHIRWSDIEDGSLWVHGGATGTKNKESRRIPIIEPMHRLLDDLRANPRYRRDDRFEYVLSVRECQKAIDRACAELGIKRFTHHDLRHLFATRCIEAGVDISTVSRWLGHRDGGALAMKTYGHLKDEHSQAMAAKVKF